jgi:hypothetical protein
MLSTAFFLTDGPAASDAFSPEKRAPASPVFKDCQALSRTHIILAAALSHGGRRPTRSRKPAAPFTAQDSVEEI